MKRRNTRRLPDYDYSGDGAYFVTMVLEPRRQSLGKIVQGQVELSAEGRVVREALLSLRLHSDRLRLDEYCIMPDHVHAIFFLESRTPFKPRRAIHELRDVAERRKQRRRMLLPLLIGRFKQYSAKRINVLRGTPGRSVWKRNYWEHVVRTNDSLERIRLYIRRNPMKDLHG